MDQPPIAPKLTDEPPALVSGDGVEASNAIDAWLSRRAMTEQPDWEGCLAQIRDGLSKLASTPLIQNDPQAVAILRDMVVAEDMEQFSGDMDRLGARVAQLLDGAPTRRMPAAILNIGALQSWGSAAQTDQTKHDKIEAPTRMRLRL